MKWRGQRRSRNIEDRRRSGSRGRVGQIGGVGLIAVLALGYFLGIDVTPLLQDAALNQQPARTTELSEAEREEGEFVSANLALTEDIWAGIFRDQLGAEYRPATLVLYSGQTDSPCGGASGATGPFYCPADRKAYLDTAFFTTLRDRLGAGGDFAAAYVIAHEIAHHVQNEIGILGEANRLRQRVSEEDSNRISVRLELQADCLSGVWARAADERFDILQRGDLGEALNAARQIGDDTLQRNAGRAVMPHTFTHGTSAQRQDWFQRGFDSRDINTCDTFGADAL